MKKQTAMKKKMDHEMDPKNRSKRKAEDLEVQNKKKLRFDFKNLKRKAADDGEDIPPKKYKFYLSKNVQQKTASTASNYDPLQEHLNDVVTQVTMPNANQQ